MIVYQRTCGRLFPLLQVFNKFTKFHQKFINISDTGTHSTAKDVICIIVININNIKITTEYRQ
jgi:hypothetical protein